MPPKTSLKGQSQDPSKTELEAINYYLSQKPDFEKLIRESRSNPNHSNQTTQPTVAMPVLPKEMNEQDSKKDNKAGDSTSGQQKATIHDHKATPGPVTAKDLPEPASKEELKKRAEELNK